MKLEISLQIFEQSLNSEFYGNPSSGKRVAPYDRKDGHDEANVAFCNFAALLKNGAGSLYYVDVTFCTITGLEENIQKCNGLNWCIRKLRNKGSWGEEISFGYIRDKSNVKTENKMWKKPVAIKQHKYTYMIHGEKVASTVLLESCKLCRSFTEVWKSPSFCMTTFSVSLTHLSALLGHMIAAAAFADDYWHRSYYWYLRRSDCRNILIELCAHDFAHSPALWHQPPFTNVTCAWLCGINLPVLSFGKWGNGPIHDSFQHTNTSLLLLVAEQMTNKPRKSAAWPILP